MTAAAFCLTADLKTSPTRTCDELSEPL